MNYAALIPLLALAIWMFALYADSKFRFFYEGNEPTTVARNAGGLRRFIILKNGELKYLGLALMWAGFSLGIVLSDGRMSIPSGAAYLLGVTGLATYVISRLWPFLSRY